MTPEDIACEIGAFANFLLFGNDFDDPLACILWLAALLDVINPMFVHTRGNLVCHHASKR
ncbi:hypothetical protein DL93DRAFT_2092046 [Clavulina sp. PMI_390]|nr:hypothetical protein DL93DRAFT_2092046 [Clavulina sp. PMI_390]